MLLRLWKLQLRTKDEWPSLAPLPSRSFPVYGFRSSHCAPPHEVDYDVLSPLFLILHRQNPSYPLKMSKSAPVVLRRSFRLILLFGLLKVCRVPPSLFSTFKSPNLFKNVFTRVSPFLNVGKVRAPFVFFSPSPLRYYKNTYFPRLPVLNPPNS